jgi:hypothetical protein
MIMYEKPFCRCDDHAEVCDLNTALASMAGVVAEDFQSVKMPKLPDSMPRTQFGRPEGVPMALALTNDWTYPYIVVPTKADRRDEWALYVYEVDPNGGKVWNRQITSSPQMVAETYANLRKDAREQAAKDKAA